MVLVVSVDDWKVRSVSRKKIRIYEGPYARFDPTLGIEVQPKHEEIHGVGDAVPDHVLSIKVLSDATRNAELNEPLVDTLTQPDPPDPSMTSSSTDEQLNQGENDHQHVPEHVEVDRIKFLETLEDLTAKALHLGAGTGVRDALIKAIKSVHDGSMGYVNKGSLKLKK